MPTFISMNGTSGGLRNCTAWLKRWVCLRLQLAMAWVLQNPLVTTVLVGARTEAHLANALAAQQMNFDPAWQRDIAEWASVACTNHATVIRSAPDASLSFRPMLSSIPPISTWTAEPLPDPPLNG